MCNKLIKLQIEYLQKFMDFCILSKNMSKNIKNIGKNISKNLIGKYTKNLIYHTNTLKNIWKNVIKKQQKKTVI